MRPVLILIGAGVTVLGYAVVYNGLSNIMAGSAAFPCGQVGVLDSLIPGRVNTATCTPSVSTGTSGTGASGKGSGFDPTEGILAVARTGRKHRRTRKDAAAGVWM